MAVIAEIAVIIDFNALFGQIVPLLGSLFYTGEFLDYQSFEPLQLGIIAGGTGMRCDVEESAADIFGEKMSSSAWKAS